MRAYLWKTLCTFFVVVDVSAYLFSLMVCLAHFDVGDQVSAGASVLDVRHGDHKVVQGNPVRLISSADLHTDIIKSLSRHRNLNAMIIIVSTLTSSLSDQLTISSPWLLLMDILRVAGIQTCRRSSARVSKVKPSVLHISSPLRKHGNPEWVKSHSLIQTESSLPASSQAVTTVYKLHS